MFINVGRGDIAKSGTLKPCRRCSRTEDLIAALDAEGGLAGAGIDVTDPEPLPADHPLFSHPKVALTPHTSGDVAGYTDYGAELLIANVERVRKGGKAMNVVDFKRGY